MIDFTNKTVFKLKESDKYATRVKELMIPGEEILMSFKSMRDGVVFTTRRIIAVNVQGLTGKKIDYTSLPYSKMVVYRI